MTEAEPPSAVYNAHPDTVGLRIATGGSGQSGLLGELATAFIKDRVAAKKVKPFLIEWYKSDTTFSILNLKNKVADVAITYHAVAEKTALETDVADRVEYAWRDHWMLIGPKENPAKLPENSQETIFSLFTKLFSAMEDTKESEKSTVENKEQKPPIKFLSRYDKSAGNIVESLLWATIGQAIREAANQGEYTVTDKGTWLAIEDATRDKLKVFAEGKDDENDPLLNPAHVLVATEAKNKETANEFADWITRKDGGQHVIQNFKKNGQVLYSTIPDGVDPLDRLKGSLGFEPSVKAAIPLPWSEDEIYFFNESKYARIDAVRDTVSYHNAFQIWTNWPGLFQTGFSPINAAFIPPGKSDEAYFFSGSRCVKLDPSSGKVSDGPFYIHDKWEGLKSVGFGTVDATLSFASKGNGYENVICFFHGRKYALIDIVKNVLLESGDLSWRFKALAKANFKSIDAAVFKPRKHHQEVYFFSGTQYVLVNLRDDHILWGPHEVKNTWKSLNSVAVTYNDGKWIQVS